MRASLIPLEGGQPIDIKKDITIVGRKENCDVRLAHASVSKVHLVIVQTNGALLFRDLGSTNGTKVNGERVIRGALLPNDKLTIAACKFRVLLAPDDAKSNGSAEAEPVEPRPEGMPAPRVLRADDLAKQSDPAIEVDAVALETDRATTRSSEKKRSASGTGHITPLPMRVPSPSDPPPLFVD